MSPSIPSSGYETKSHLTRKIKEVQSEREPLRQAILDFGRHREKTYAWVCANDNLFHEWVVLTFVDDGGYRVASAEVRGTLGTVTGNVCEGGELTTPNAAQAGNERNDADGASGRIGRPGETSASDWFDNGRRRRSRVQLEHADCAASSTATERVESNLFMDEIDHLTTTEAGHADLSMFASWRTNAADLTMYTM